MTIFLYTTAYMDAVLGETEGNRDPLNRKKEMLTWAS
jgi:hypothetical protein